MKREIYDTDQQDFRAMVRAFVAKEVTPHLASWEAAGQVDRVLYRAAGAVGLLGLGVEEEYGGSGVDDFRYNAVLNEELCRAGATSVVMNLNGFTDLVAPYFRALATPEQKARWLPGLADGSLVAAIAMTEPGAGSDLRGIRTRAERRRDGYLLNGTKIFISNGILADLVIVVARTTADDGQEGLNLLVVERGMPGFERGRKLDKLGLSAQDTAELSFTDVLVPAANLLGEEGRGMEYLKRNLSQERLSVTVTAAATMRRVLEETIAYTRDRIVFGRPLSELQATRFTLAELATETEIAQTFTDRCVAELASGRLTDTEAAMAKWWVTERQQHLVSRCLQLHGGYGYMTEYPIARDFVDTRASTLFAGTTEIMKEIIGKSLLR
ncbi:acyl-CoA dehydrogenase family protein [Streptomyces sp. DG2A-72]|uniref:acyl-CoA dehydrogenase family protein n=1 Tax=Streptomyces sp. DG2A-72 TaxID=3051386 RepID=UPI00265C8604|nr:acyl-CoA dehydrogenase family protein [Streptomyces sp. DG2A-72]MDO0932221.1 acyl-CoA dehydrogenase family protein [Streptomyces sp. DG2A-72]